ncbi:hypothetical protein CANARDRAFT_68168 [[Candida] arabinofermentans NRRL YB-2248]|uniref:Uncharacterized protein n=1 Tax=[Candida] arabinofermentans NRRL YB-2248 TaxID=983967 RepID=A0A1E4SXA6_9ASCO|nr:hypothetical protein CANARDRAFT_68168 [[Candida] arabinofermentans NRRL YB-2248]
MWSHISLKELKLFILHYNRTDGYIEIISNNAANKFMLSPPATTFKQLKTILASVVADQLLSTPPISDLLPSALAYGPLRFVQEKPSLLAIAECFDDFTEYCAYISTMDLTQILDRHMVSDANRIARKHRSKATHASTLKQQGYSTTGCLQPPTPPVTTTVPSNPDNSSSVSVLSSDANSAISSTTPQVPSTAIPKNRSTKRKKPTQSARQSKQPS